jgi:hypothetical protein
MCCWRGNRKDTIEKSPTESFNYEVRVQPKIPQTLFVGNKCFRASPLNDVIPVGQLKHRERVATTRGVTVHMLASSRVMCLDLALLRQHRNPKYSISWSSLAAFAHTWDRIFLAGGNLAGSGPKAETFRCCMSPIRL